MARTRVKICGVMRLEDALLACEAGADAIGMIFHPPARRKLDLESAARIARALGAFVTPVGVFVDAPAEMVLRTARTLRSGLVQLHGRETPEAVRPIVEAGIRIIKALRVDDTLEEQVRIWRGFFQSTVGLAGIVLETASDAPGGTGIANDWSAIAEHQRNGLFGGLPIIVAGGLHPDNVGDVVRIIRPWAVDVSSGTEASLGVKSREKVFRFVEEVRRADDGR